MEAYKNNYIKMENIITYEMLIDDELKDGVFAMSLVTSPAIQSDYVLLSEQQDKKYIELKLEKLADIKRHIVSGAALIPNIIIPRKDDADKEYNITFSEDTIRKISENFLIQNKKDNVTLQHQISVNDVYLVESWIVDDPKNDKSKVLGLDVPKGTWCISMKITNPEIWQEFIESGQLKGFSLEGQFTQKEVHLHNENCNHQELSDEDKEIVELINILLYSASDLDKLYLWQATSSDQCPACQDNNGQVKTLREWCNLAIPRTPNGTTLAGITTSYPFSPFGTFCEMNCKCKLIALSNPKPARKKRINPWK